MVFTAAKSLFTAVTEFCKRRAANSGANDVRASETIKQLWNIIALDCHRRRQQPSFLIRLKSLDTQLKFGLVLATYVFKMVFSSFACGYS